MYAGYHEEGDNCPECKSDVLEFIREENCSCHINPPCSACVNVKLTCPGCGWSAPDHEPEYKYVPVDPMLSQKVYRPRPLDNTKVDFVTKSHTNSSMIKEGVYPDGMSKDEVRKVVNGTFGGRFAQFGNGKFRFIAYTD